MKRQSSEHLSDAQRAYAACLRARLDFWRAQPLAGNYWSEIARREALEEHPLAEAERAAAEQTAASPAVTRGVNESSANPLFKWLLGRN